MLPFDKGQHLFNRSPLWLSGVFGRDNPWFSDEFKLNNPPSEFDAGLRMMLNLEARAAG